MTNRALRLLSRPALAAGLFLGLAAPLLPGIAVGQARAAAAAPAQVQVLRQRITKADELPRFSYPVQGSVEALVRDPQKFAAFSGAVQRDTQSVLDRYDIAEKSTHRQLLNTLAQAALLEERWDDALHLADEIRTLQEKPAERLLTGLQLRAIVAAARKVGNRRSPEFAAEVGRQLAAALEPLPFLVVRNDIQGAKASAEQIGEGLAMGSVRNVLQPVADRSGALSSDLAPGVISTRYVLEYVLPLKEVFAATYKAYLAAHKVDKPDIWAARDAALPPGRNFTPVKVVIWDSGVDTSLFPGRLVERDGQPAFIAFDLEARPSASPLRPIPPALLPRLDALQARSKGLSDLRSNIDSPEAAAVRTLLSTLTPEQYKTVIEELRLVGNYQHGTHVAGIAAAGNPYIRLANARIEFGHTLLPDPCPTPSLEARTTDNFARYADFIRGTGARVVNMSWGGNLRAYEVELEQCQIGKDLRERREIARRYFEAHLKALTQAMAALPEVLFVASAGNSGNDPSFQDAYPSGIVLPNLVVVGAVDQAGDETGFTSYGPTVALHANGYQVDSVVPGGRHIAFSGTSMAAPQVTNLAAKLLAVNPALKPAELIALMRQTADRSEDGRRVLIDPKKALAQAGAAL
ncbi:MULTISPECIES: S8 family serine peptidase [Ramlibacter]|uniref:S8 family serine peptidase n=1 Tax=Ramlibacter aquaticus TaxID=2780094 RepID=A0ABR9SG46_9BURK|nr:MULTISPECIES: S8 family serine peptidase [Ramlibacter]MBE7941323.1 S8 family serine peptidase [Ramlibacter aquaticus]